MQADNGDVERPPHATDLLATPRGPLLRRRIGAGVELNEVKQTGVVTNILVVLYSDRIALQGNSVSVFGRIVQQKYN